MVYVLDRDGNALMPTERHGKVRRLLRDGQAVVVRRTPFTVRLLYDTTRFVQEVTLGVDAGITHIGLSATTDTKELFSSEVTLRKDIAKNIRKRREARMTRRSRNTRYRSPRFDNRRRPDGWIFPSTEQKIQSHLNLITKVRGILPVSSTVIEVAQFDTQMLRDPEIRVELGFWNTREYVLFRDNHECQCCHGKSKDPVLNVIHVEHRQTGGDSPSDLVTLCRSCREAYRSGEEELHVRSKGRSLNDANIMVVMRWKLYDRAKALWDNVHLTYGYVTKHTRITCGLERSHCVDARCISGHPAARPCPEHYEMQQTRRHNRQIHKANLLSGGRRRAGQAPHLVNGFRLFDKVMLGGTECFIFGRRTNGYFDVELLDGTKIHAGVSYRKLQFVEPAKRYLCSTKKRGTGAVPPPPDGGNIHAHLS